MIPKECFDCGSTEFLVGKAATQVGREIFPHYCANCGMVYATAQASKEELAVFRAIHGDPLEVMTSTQRKIADGVDYQPSRTAGKSCEVCGAKNDLHVHHWAPVHLFGVEASRWPTSILCQPCHAQWHRIVTPRMGRRGSE